MPRQDLGLAALIGTLVVGIIALFLAFPGDSVSQSSSHAAPDSSKEAATGDTSEHKEQDIDPEKASEVHADEVRLAPDILKSQDIQWDTAQPRALKQKLILPGKISAVQDQLGHLSPQVSGIVTGVFKHLGDTVKQGEVLATLRSTELGKLRLQAQQAQELYTQAKRRYTLEKTFTQHSRALIQALSQSKSLAPAQTRLSQATVGQERQQLTTAYTRYQRAAQDHQREQALLKNKATTGIEADNAEKAWIDAQAHYQGTVEEILKNHELLLMDREAERLSAKTALDMAQQALSVLNTSVASTGTEYALRSPMTGTLLAKHIALGENISADTRVFTIANLNTVWAEMMIPEQHLDQVRLNTPLEVRSQASNHLSSGRVSHIQSAVDPDSQTVEAHAEIPNPKGWWKPDMYVAVAIETQAVQVPLAVQRDAVQPFEQGFAVFVAHEDAIQALPVRLGRESRDWIEITAGLKKGQRYIAKNAFLIKAELEKSNASHSH